MGEGDRLTSSPRRLRGGRQPGDEAEAAELQSAGSRPENIAAGNYRLERELGRHGGVATYLVTEIGSGRPLVLKRFRWSAALPGESAALFEERAGILATLDHPGLPRFTGFSCSEEGLDTVCDLMLEYVPGESIASAAAIGRRFSEGEVRELLRRGAAILSYLHGRVPPLVHRNIRPSNLILAADGALHMTDLDFLVRPVSPDPVVTFGAPWLIGGCTPPEALHGEWTPASDVFSLGVAAIVALTGREPPFRGGAAGDWSAEGLVTVSPELARIVTRMTASEPSLRYADGSTLAAALAPPQPVAPQLMPPAPQVPRLRHRRPARRSAPARMLHAVQVALALVLLVIAGQRWQKTWDWLHPEISGPVLSRSLPRGGGHLAETRLSPEASVHRGGEPIRISYEGMSGSHTDWITLVRADAAPNTYAEWHYTGGKTRGTMTFSGLRPGNYEARAYFNWPGGGYTVRGRGPVVVVD